MSREDSPVYSDIKQSRGWLAFLNFPVVMQTTLRRANLVQCVKFSSGLVSDTN